MKRVLLAVATLSILSSCKTAGNLVVDIAQYCREHPEECSGASTPAPTRTPVVSVPTATPVSVPTAAPLPPQATPTAAPTLNPTAAPIATPGASQGPCVVPGPAPMTTAYHGAKCPYGMEPVEFDVERFTPPGSILCACISQDRRDQHRTSWLLGYGLDRQGMVLVNVGGAWLQRNPGRDGYTDACGRRFMDDLSLYTNPSDAHPEYGWGGYSLPVECVSAPTQPIPEPTPFIPSSDVPSNRHLEKVKIGGGCLAEDVMPDGQIKCKKDTTAIYPCGPCDQDHAACYNDPTVCNGRTLDDIRGWIWRTDPEFPECSGNDRDSCWRWYSNSQRWYYVPKGAHVRFTVCPRRDMGAPVDHVKYENHGYDDLILEGDPAKLEAIPRIPVAVQGDGCYSIEQDF